MYDVTFSVPQTDLRYLFTLIKSLRFRPKFRLTAANFTELLALAAVSSPQLTPGQTGKQLLRGVSVSHSNELSSRKTYLTPKNEPELTCLPARPSVSFHKRLTRLRHTMPAR